MVPSELDTTERLGMALIPVSGIHTRHLTSDLSLCGNHPCFATCLLMCICVWFWQLLFGETNIKHKGSVYSQGAVEMYVKNFSRMVL